MRQYSSAFNFPKTVLTLARVQAKISYLSAFLENDQDICMILYRLLNNILYLKTCVYVCIFCRKRRITVGIVLKAVA